MKPGDGGGRRGRGEGEYFGVKVTGMIEKGAEVK